MSDRPDFIAATWNVYYGTPLKVVAERVDAVRRQRADLLLVQEASADGIRGVFRAGGYRCGWVAPQYLIGWDPALWHPVREEDPVRPVRLSDTTYWRVTGRPVHKTVAARALLRHKATGLVLDALSYHTPAGVQEDGRPNPAVPNRVQVLRDAMSSLSRVAAESGADAILYGGDDNVDESRGSGWAFMRRAATGLRQVQAPVATHGRKGDRGRKIDDFRVRGLRPVDPVRVLPGGGDHRIHLRGWQFRDAPRN